MGSDSESDCKQSRFPASSYASMAWMSCPADQVIANQRLHRPRLWGELPFTGNWFRRTQRSVFGRVARLLLAIAGCHLSCGLLASGDDVVTAREYPASTESDRATHQEYPPGFLFDAVTDEQAIDGDHVGFLLGEEPVAVPDVVTQVTFLEPSVSTDFKEPLDFDSPCDEPWWNSGFDMVEDALPERRQGKLLEAETRVPVLQRFWLDQKNFYSPESLTLLGGGLVVGGVMANTTIDDGLARHFQSSLRHANSDDWFESLHASKELGNGMYSLPVFATAWAVGEFYPESELLAVSGRWGERSLRGFVVGAPPLIVLQKLTGGSRPNETNEGSEWHPWHDDNGVSGHAFMGSLPFITAAKMTDHRGYKLLFYAGSTIAPASRVNDNVHYPSQALLGWWMAYLSASAIHATDNPDSRWHFFPYANEDSSGIAARFEY